jgi:aspartyl-tRNA(Asn)/glutamyl-tRNA(Gln) amidotransferase subunit A
MSLVEMTATDLVKALGAGEVTAVELTGAFLSRIQQTEPRLQAFIQVQHDSAMAAAERVDERRRRGDSLGPLAGLPVAIKDVFCTREGRTTCGSRMLENFRSPYNATVVQRLLDADAVIVGKTNMDEFAMGSSTENSAFGGSRNPWNLECVPGGSSGGAAVAAAARQAPLSVGTDTGGSIRQPAAFCGIVGLKPTYGRVSRYGLVAFASSLDQAGPMTRTAADAALLLQVLAGHDPLDSTSAEVEIPDYHTSLASPLTGMRIGLVRDHFGEGLDPEVERAVREAARVLESLGAKLQEISLPHGKYGMAAYYVIAPCEASSNLARYDGVHYGYRTDEAEMLRELAAERKELAGDSAKVESPLTRMYRRSRTEGFGLEVKRRIMLGTFALSAGYQNRYYLKAQQVRRLIRSDYEQAFQQVDLVLGPTTPTAAFPLGEKTEDPLAMYLGDLYTVGANLSGLAAISVPCGFNSSGLPIGFQLQAPPFAESRLLQVAHGYQTQTDWHQRSPDVS